MNINGELKDCPFCGKKPMINYIFGKPIISCENEKCLLKTSTFLNKEENFKKLVAAWDKRI